MSKKAISLILVYSIVFVAYAILFFLIPFPKSIAAWTEFAFTLISIISGLGITYYAFSKSETLKSKIYGFPVFRIGAVYTIAQISFGIVICLIGIFVTVPAWIPAAASIVLLMLTALGTIVSDNARDVIEQQEQNDKVSTKTMTYFRLDIQSIVDMCGDAELKKRLIALNDNFKYSDPVSSYELKAIEAEIQDEIKKLSSAINSDVSAAAQITEKIERLLADRNRRCKALKKA